MAQEAEAYGNVGDRENAFKYLERAYAGADEELLFALRLPAFDFLRSDPRYADLMHRLNLPD